MHMPSVIHRMPIKKSTAFAIIHRENRLRDGKVIDVSEHNQDIDWEKVKNSDIDFAILRVGYGNDV